MKNRYLFVLLYWLGLTLSWGQSSVVTIRQLPPTGVWLDKGWKWHAGDNPDWAKPEFDDSAWENIDPTQDIMDLPKVRKAGIGWIRLHIQIDSTLARESALAFRVFQASATELYSNGQLVQRLGTVSSRAYQVVAAHPYAYLLSLAGTGQSTYVLAVRTAFQPNLPYTKFANTRNHFYALRVHAFNQIQVQQVNRANTNAYIFLKVGVFLVLALLHFFFFVFYPSQKVNLFFALSTLLSFQHWLLLGLFTNLQITNLETVMYLGLLRVLLYPVNYLFLLTALYIVYGQTLSYHYWVCAGSCGLLILIYLYNYTDGVLWVEIGSTVITMVEAIRITGAAVIRKHRGSGIILIGMVFSFIGVSLRYLTQFTSLLPWSVAGGTYSKLVETFENFGLLSIPISLSIYLASEFASNNKRLSAQLIEVNKLTARALTQEQENQQLLTTQNETLEAQLKQRTQEIEQQSRLLQAQHIRQLETEFEHKLADTEMTALRAQMNPHFIFNCLNSIKLYTLENEADKASDYLTKFARLIRLVLENSRSELVTLHNELEALQLYIELEAMRFKHKVQFTIHVSPGIDQRFIRIPPLLLQPYVENAIWHGLMHKPEGGTVTVEVTQPQENLLHIEITDDGIGRQRASELKSKSAGKHKSFGMQVTADRIRMINQLYNIHTQAEVVDLVDSDGEPCGTRVILEIPV